MTDLSRVVVLDVETSGLDPARHGILEFGACFLDRAPMSVWPSEFTMRLRLSAGLDWDARALEVNGIDAASIYEHPNTSEKSALLDFFSWVGAQPFILAGMNVGKFDLAFLTAAMRRHPEVTWPKVSHRTLDLHSVAMAYAVRHNLDVDVTRLTTDAIYAMLGMLEEPKPHRALTGASQEDAYAYLAAKAGVDTSNRSTMPLVPLRAREPEPEKVLARLSGADLEAWKEGVTYLSHHASPIQNIATWRGFSFEAVMELVNAGKIGLMKLAPWMRRQDPQPGEFRVAFPVEGMIDGKVELVAYHLRLKPREGEKRASWRFVPSGVGAWPYILGDALTARFLIVCEGQWDAMACFDALGVSYAALMEERIAICAMRGAANWRLFVEHFLLAHGTKRPDTRCLVICDADQAGEEWTTPSGDEPGFVAILQAVCSQVWVREPGELFGKDLNDVWKTVRQVVAA